MKVLENKTKKARKQHRCCLCGELINVGEEYNNQTLFYADDGDFVNMKSHKECLKYAEEIGDIDEVAEDLFDYQLEQDCITYNIKVDSKLDAVKLILQKKKIKNERF